MSTDAQYGTDIFFDADIEFTTNDVRLQDGPRLVAQDIKRTASIALGALPWDTTAGSTIPNAVNATDTTPQTIQAELVRIARADPRINPSSITATYAAATKTAALTFQVIDHVPPVTLNFNIQEDSQ